MPAGALTAARITLTPLKRIAGLPLNGAPVGVQFGPDGLQLRRPASLTITLKHTVRRATVGYVYSGKGNDFKLLRAKRAAPSSPCGSSTSPGRGQDR